MKTEENTDNSNSNLRPPQSQQDQTIYGGVCDYVCSQLDHQSSWKCLLCRCWLYSSSRDIHVSLGVLLLHVREVQACVDTRVQLCATTTLRRKYKILICLLPTIVRLLIIVLFPPSQSNLLVTVQSRVQYMFLPGQIKRGVEMTIAVSSPCFYTLAVCQYVQSSLWCSTPVPPKVRKIPKTQNEHL